MKISILFPSPPEIGTRFALGGQEYIFSGHEPYQRSDGTDSSLLIWDTFCADCSEPFAIRTPLGFTTGQARRCKEHRRPGKAVR